MYSFANDYSEGACPEIVKAIVRNNFEQNVGYGLDKHSLNATSLIKKRIGNTNVDIHFITGGTPCNVLAMQILKPYEAIIACESGHINVHETGAVEHNGHKILTAKGEEGKLRPSEIEEIVSKHTDEHMVKPKLVFISQATELGTTYSLDELKAIRQVCNKLDLILYIDGARLSNALVATGIDIKDIASVADMFYIGGTKNGAYIGEAFVIKKDSLKNDFRYIIKQNCSMLAKGFFVGMEFEEFFIDDLYLKNAKHANQMADKVRYALKMKGIRLFVETKTNQVFAIFNNQLLEKLQKEFIVEKWGKYSETETVVRFVTSWATTQDGIKQLEDFLARN